MSIVKITKDASGAVSYETDKGSVVWFSRFENVMIKNDVANVTILVDGSVLTLPVATLTINGVASSANAKTAAQAIATGVFNPTA